MQNVLISDMQIPVRIHILTLHHICQCVVADNFEV